jgi:hypothetical protein
MAAMTHDVLTALKRLAQREKWLTARPKEMRFQIFCSPRKLVSHARKTWLRVRRLKEQLAEWIESLLLLPVPIRMLPPHGRIIQPLSESTCSSCGRIGQRGRAAINADSPLNPPKSLLSIQFSRIGSISPLRDTGSRLEPGPHCLTDGLRSAWVVRHIYLPVHCTSRLSRRKL